VLSILNTLCWPVQPHECELAAAVHIVCKALLPLTTHCLACVTALKSSALSIYGTMFWPTAEYSASRQKCWQNTLHFVALSKKSCHLAAFDWHKVPGTRKYELKPLTAGRTPLSVLQQTLAMLKLHNPPVLQCYRTPTWLNQNCLNMDAAESAAVQFAMLMPNKSWEPADMFNTSNSDALWIFFGIMCCLNC